MNEDRGVWDDAKHLLEWRKDLGIGQEELARAAGVSHQLISFIETEARTFTEPLKSKLWGAISRLHSERVKKRRESVRRTPDLDEAAEHMTVYSLAKRGRQLRKYRTESGIDLDYIAHMAGTTKSTLSKFERGKNDLSVATYARLLDAIEQIVEARGEVLAFENRVRNARSRGTAMLAELSANPIPDNDEELKQWRAEETKNQIERRKRQSYTDHIKERYEAEIADLEKRIRDLRDLLHLETEAAIKEYERDELREKIKSRGKE